MRDYRTMSPCERVSYYRFCLKELITGRGDSNDVLARVFEELIEENLQQCRNERKTRHGAAERS